MSENQARARIRRSRDMSHVQKVAVLPKDGRYVPLRIFLAAFPGAREQRTRYKNAVHFLLERGDLNVVACHVRQRAKRLYDTDQIPFVRAVIQMHRNGLTLDKAVKIARQRKEIEQGRLF